MTAENTSGSASRPNGTSGADRSGGIRRAVPLPAADDTDSVLAALRPRRSGTATRPEPPSHQGAAAAATAPATADASSVGAAEQPDRATLAEPSQRAVRTAVDGRQSSAGAFVSSGTRAGVGAGTRGDSLSLLAAGNGRGEAASAADDDYDGHLPDQPKKPMLAAAALAGVLLLGIPLLLISGDDDEKKREDVSTTARDTVLGEQFENQAPPSLYVPGTPQDGSGSPKPSPSEKEKKKKEEEKGKEPAGTPKDRTSGSPNTGSSPRADQDEAQQSRPAPPAPPPSTPSSYWEFTPFSVANVNNGNCLTTTVNGYAGTGSCSSQWTRYVMQEGRTMLLKSNATNECLDTNGTAVYMSRCVSSDSGQVWRAETSSGCEVYLVNGSHYLTGWNDGKVSVRAKGDVDVEAKQKWRISDC